MDKRIVESKKDEPRKNDGINKLMFSLFICFQKNKNMLRNCCGYDLNNCGGDGCWLYNRTRGTDT